jgi:hypothetical protein
VIAGCYVQDKGFGDASYGQGLPFLAFFAIFFKQKGFLVRIRYICILFVFFDVLINEPDG